MRIQTPTDIIAEACQGIYHLGRPQVGTAEHLINALDAAGFEIVRRAGPRPSVAEVGEQARSLARWPEQIMDRLREVLSEAGGRDTHANGRVVFRVPETPRLGTVATLTPEGERIVQAIAAGDFTGISDRDYKAFTVLVDRVLEGDRTSARLRDLDAAIHRAERPLPAGEAVRYDYVRDPHLETPLRAGEERSLPRGEVVTSDETDADADALDRLAREAAPDADGPDDIEEMEDGTIRVTSAGLAEIAGWSYGVAGRWFRQSGLSGQVDLAEVERVLAGQAEGDSEPAYIHRDELTRALKAVRRRAEHAGKRAAAADQVRAAAARLALLKALSAARLVIPHSELVQIVSQLDTGRAA